MPKNPYNNLLFDHINGFEFFLISLVLILSCLPYLKRGQLLVSRHLAVVIYALCTHDHEDNNTQLSIVVSAGLTFNQSFYSISCTVNNITEVGLVFVSSYFDELCISSMRSGKSRSLLRSQKPSALYVTCPA